MEKTDVTLPTKKKLDKFGILDYTIMNSSSNSNDCLIHSFLTATSRNFCRLQKRSRDEVASFFRRQIYPLIIDEADISDKAKQENKKLALSKDLLEDTDIIIISKYYKINFIIFEDEKAEKLTRH